MMLAPDNHTCCRSSCELRQDSEQQWQRKVIVPSMDSCSSSSSFHTVGATSSKPAARLAFNCRTKMPKNEETGRTDTGRVGSRDESVERSRNRRMQELQVRTQIDRPGKGINRLRYEHQSGRCCLNEVKMMNANGERPLRTNQVLKSDNKSPTSHLFLSSNRGMNLMPTLLLVCALILAPIGASSGQLAVLAAANFNSRSASLSSPSASGANLMMLGEEQLLMPPYTPTRAPQASRRQQPSHNSSTVAKQAEWSAATTNVRGQQAALGSRSPLLSSQEPKAAGSTKFTRTNELDVFLDDMNHNELRTVAAGRPIDDFFKPKPSATMASAEQQQGLSGSKLAPQQSRKRSPAGDNNGSGNVQARAPPAPQAADLDSGSPSQPRVYSECALILQRTYVKNLDDPKHQLVPYGKTEQACISYKHIDKAVEQAKHQLKFRELTKKRKKALMMANGAIRKPLPPFEIVHSTLEPPEDLIAAIGEINMATTQIIADQFDLSHDEILNGLPLIDMSKTKFWPICPLVVRQDLKCEITRFRTFTGHCNNLKHPTWGAAMTPFARYLPPVHPDGIWVPRKSIVIERASFGFDSQHHNSMLTVNDEMMGINNQHDNININNNHHHLDESIGGHNLDHVIDDNNINNLEQEGSHHEEPGHNQHGNNDARMPTMPMPVFHHDRVHHHIHTNEMATASSSVKFVRHVYPEHTNAHTRAQLYVGGDSRRQQQQLLNVAASAANSPIDAQSTIVDGRSSAGHSSGGHTISDGSLSMAPSPSAPQTPPLLLVGERTIGSHYQQSHSPVRPYSATATPIDQQLGSRNGSPGNQLQLHQHQQHRHQLLAVASTMPMHQLHKSRAKMALELPSARLVTSVVHRDVDLPHHDFTILFMSWGQLLDHDLTRAAQSPSSIKCCNKDGKPKHRLCLPIQVPQNDPFYSKFNVDCLEFRRTLAGVRPNCVLGPRVHQNAITSPIDANFIYGSSQALAEALRLFKGGRLRDRDWFKRESLKPILPAQDMDPDLECIARPKDLFCFLAGDVRANEQTHLTVLHTLYMREHNRIADKLAELNPHWDDERTYQETRHIMAAGVQHVMINEYVPLLIGRKMTELYNLTAQPHDTHAGKHSYWRGYDPTVTTSVSNSFAAAAFRQGHTFVQGSVERYNKYHEFVASEKLRHLFKQPFLMYQPGVIDELTGGMINQPSQSYDPFISEDISGHLFQPPESQFGHDLAAINLQRGREQGLPGYNLFREWCGLPRAETFDQLEPYLTNHTAFHYSRLYKHVDDIDLWSGGVSERKLPGAAIGPTFACIIARQFSNTRRGDRFWYENPGFPSSFTPEQLAEIRKITLAKLLCANSDDLPTIQRWALRMPHPVLNPRIPCHELPELDLQFWQEE